jgi:hypothetical protein
MLRSVFLAGALSAIVAAQSSNYVAAAGYAFPEPVSLAPGGVITLFARGLNVPDAVATSDPLPTVLNGVSVIVKNSPAVGYPTALPILSIRSDANACGGGLTAFCNTTAFTVHIPYEPTCIPDNFPNSCKIGPPPSVHVALQVNGNSGQEFWYYLGGLPHFLNSCDSLFGRPSGECLPSVTHADGSPVRVASPAHAGERITIYALGMGQTMGGAQTGKVVRAADPLQGDIYPLQGDIYMTPAYLMNTPASDFIVSSQALKADWAGLATGFVGLYQINLRLPVTLPAGLNTCSGNGNVRLVLGHDVFQNLVNTAASVDVCVSQ